MITQEEFNNLQLGDMVFMNLSDDKFYTNKDTNLSHKTYNLLSDEYNAFLCWTTIKDINFGVEYSNLHYQEKDNLNRDVIYRYIKQYISTDLTCLSFVYSSRFYIKKILKRINKCINPYCYKECFYVEQNLPRKYHICGTCEMIFPYYKQHLEFNLPYYENNKMIKKYTQKLFEIVKI